MNTAEYFFVLLANRILLPQTEYLLAAGKTFYWPKCGLKVLKVWSPTVTFLDADFRRQGPNCEKHVEILYPSKSVHVLKPYKRNKIVKTKSVLNVHLWALRNRTRNTFPLVEPTEPLFQKALEY